MFSTRGDFEMENTGNERIAKKIAKLAKSKNVSWVFENGKIFLRFKINLADINYDCAMMAAFEYKKRIISAGNSEYMIIFECKEENLEAIFHGAEVLCEEIMEEARTMSDYENSHELKNDMRLHASAEIKTLINSKK